MESVRWALVRATALTLALTLSSGTLYGQARSTIQASARVVDTTEGFAAEGQVQRFVDRIMVATRQTRDGIPTVDPRISFSDGHLRLSLLCDDFQSTGLEDGRPFNAPMPASQAINPVRDARIGRFDTGPALLEEPCGGDRSSPSRWVLIVLVEYIAN